MGGFLGISACRTLRASSISFLKTARSRAVRMRSSAESQSGRVKQILAAREAIERALKRRGMDATHELRVQIVGKFSLRQKSTSGKSTSGNQAPA